MHGLDHSEGATVSQVSMVSQVPLAGETHLRMSKVICPKTPPGFTWSVVSGGGGEDEQPAGPDQCGAGDAGLPVAGVAGFHLTSRSLRFGAYATEPLRAPSAPVTCFGEEASPRAGLVG